VDVALEQPIICSGGAEPHVSILVLVDVALEQG